MKRLFFILLTMAMSLTLMAQPGGINYQTNRIDCNGDDWDELIDNFNNLGELRIVHIGDSHIRPGIVTDEVRKALQQYPASDSDSVPAMSSKIQVESIGINGATYSSYLSRNSLSQQLRRLEPQLVIVSLGTNEAYGRYSSLTGNIESLLYIIRRACPGVKFLLTTPLETQKYRGRGYTIQSGIAEVRDIIVNYGKLHHVAVWDFYRVGGGAGASYKWHSAGYMGGDRIHLTSAGYHLQGELLAEALLCQLADDPETVSEPDAE